MQEEYLTLGAECRLLNDPGARKAAVHMPRSKLQQEESRSSVLGLDARRFLC